MKNGMAQDTRKSSFGQLNVSSLFCPNCNQAQSVTVKLLLSLPHGDKYAYYCQQCGAELADKIERNK